MTWLRGYAHKPSFVRFLNRVPLLALGPVLVGASSLQAATITIVTQPQDKIVNAGETITFTVSATTDAGTISYQWYTRTSVNTPYTAIPGATSPSYTTPPMNLSQNGSRYSVRVSCPGATTVTSRNAEPIVRGTPTITIVSQPWDPIVNAGQTATFMVSASSSSGALGYQWYTRASVNQADIAIPGATSPSYTTPACTLSQNGSRYSVRVSCAGATTVTSRSAELVVKPAPGPNAELFLPTSVHPGDSWMKASVPIQTGMTYLWTVIPGTSTATITSGQGTGVITFTAGSSVGTFQIQANVQNQSGDYVTATRTITVETGSTLVVNGQASVGRAQATATLLPSGRVLVVGGNDNTYYPSGHTLASTELYDPATQTWTLTGSLVTDRQDHTATLLPNGKVLVLGGRGSSGVFAAAVLYDPATGIWTPAGNLGTARYYHTATLLQNGKVLVAGGTNAGTIASPELYDPSTGTFTPTGALGLDLNTATLLRNGKVLVTGGGNAELYDPATGTWTPTGAVGMNLDTATLLSSGKVLATGPYVGADAPWSVQIAKLYDPATGAWTSTGTVERGRGGGTATLLPNGMVLITGGLSDSTSALSSANIYNPATGTWTPAGSLIRRYDHTATALQNGKVLVAGGSQYEDGSQGVETAQIYDFTTGTWSLAVNQ